MSKRLVVVFFGVALLAGCGREAAQSQPIRPVRIQAVSAGDSADTRLLSGQIQAHREIELSFRLAGELKQRFVEVGEQLAPGDPVAQLDSEVQQDTRRSAQAAYDSAIAVLEQVETNEQRLRDLLAEHAVSKSAYDSALRELRTAREQVKATSAQLDSANKQLGYTRLTAPMPGLVTRKWAEPGEVVAAGQPVISLAGSDDWDLLLDVPADLIRKGLTTGQQVKVWLAGETSVETTATIREISPLADAVTLTHALRAQLDSRPAGMLLGSTVLAELRLQRRDGFVIPATALTAMDEQPAVWLVDTASMTVSRQVITPASYGKDQVLVTQGLKDGDLVVTAGSQLLHEGQQVRLLGDR